MILQRKCNIYQLPGNEICRKQDLCVFAIDGSTQVNFACALSHLGQFFSNHASLWDNPAQYIYHVLYRVDQTDGCQFIGYSSKVLLSA